ncbi:Centromere protein [Parasponia andersonii]|uniref:Centromere protein n=1 Tax=Parasponia andersonii TaxID=3476 RepID=A0A2P5CZ65_PARAD|nr:Centromere protein [Parasponia andersonii]
MVTDNRGSDLVDPLQGYSGLALFPKTFEVLPEASKPYDFDHDLQTIHNNLKSMALRSHLKLRDQAKVIVDGSSKILKSKVSTDKNETVPGMAEGNPRERRPALGRKRARFSVKPDSSQPAMSFEQPTLDIKSIKDPETFFMAYERHENAKREIQKQMGGPLSELDEQNPSQIERRRRPGMLKRSVKYKHLYSSEISETNKNVLSSQETFDSSINSPVYHSSQPKSDHNFTSQETELAGSIHKEEDKVDEILDQLLSYNGEDLEGDRAVCLLQERLRIKPIELEKLRLPDFQDIPKIDLKSSRSGKLPKRSHVLSDIDNLLKGLSSKTPMQHRHWAESTVHHIASPTPSKSPLASLSVLNQTLFLRSNSSNDPFSAHDIDKLPVTYPSSIQRNKQFDSVNVGRQSETVSPLVEKDDNIEVAEIGSPKAAIRDFTHTNDKYVNDGTTRQDEVIDMGSRASPVPVDDSVNIVRQSETMSPLFEKDDNIEVAEIGSIRDFTHTYEKSVNDGTTKQDEVIDVGSSASPVPVDDNIIDSNMDNSVVNEKLCMLHADGNAQAKGANVEDTVEDTLRETMVSTQSGLHQVDSSLDNLNKVQNHLDKPSTTSSEDGGRDMHSGIPDNGSEQHTEMVQENSRIPLDKKCKAKSDSQKAWKRREISGSGRKSLGGAGTKWESGVRRSTRIRCRPLEYWKGERLLYGRIHKSLPTVIGLKYASPEKGNGKIALKVKSYVSDEHKELLELVALH